MTVRRVERVTYAAERVVPCRPCQCDPYRTCTCKDEHTQQRTFFVEWAAYQWVARGALFRARAQRCRCKQIKHDYNGSPAWDGGPEQCDLCADDLWRPKVRRLARILRSRDRALALLAAVGGGTGRRATTDRATGEKP